MSWTREEYTAHLKEFTNTNEYTEMYCESGVTAMSRQMDNVEGVGKTRYKFSGIIPYDTDLVFITMNTYDNMEERKLWDKQFVEYKLLDTVASQDLQNIVYWENTCWPYYLSNRDWICHGTHVCEKSKDGNQYVTLARKTNHEKDPKDGYAVRCDMYLWAVMLKPVKVDTKMFTQYTIMCQFDPQGWIPGYVMSWGLYTFPKEYDQGLRTGCEIFGKKQVKIQDFKINGYNEINNQ